MANGYFERGELYWVKYGDSLGAEEMGGRPGVIVSCDKGNASSPIVNVALLTTQPKHLSINVQTFVGGVKRWVLCNQILTVDKARLSKYIGKLNAQEMKEVDDALEEVFDLGYVDEAALKQKESEIADLNLLIGEAKASVAKAHDEIAKRDEEIASLKMEIEMWQKCYGRCMDMLVDVKVSGDVARRTAKVEGPVITPVDPPKQPEPPKEPEPEEDRLDINNCTATALKKAGFSLAMARKIVQARPFESVEDLKRVNGLKSNLYRILEPKLCCNPMVKKLKEQKVEFVKDEPDPGYEAEEPVVETVEPVVEVPEARKVNVNTASAKEIHEVTGISVNQCYSITAHRKKNGPFESIDDLLKVKNIFRGTIAKCKDLLEL